VHFSSLTSTDAGSNAGNSLPRLIASIIKRLCLGPWSPPTRSPTVSVGQREPALAGLRAVPPAAYFELIGPRRVAVIGAVTPRRRLALRIFANMVSSRQQFCVIVCQLVPSRHLTPI
jgi:hypothetical protein